MDSIIFTAVIGALSGLVGALIIALQSSRALRSEESRAREEMEQRLRIAQSELDARLAIARSEQKNTFKLAALDKRLESYQAAFSRWVELRNHLFDQNAGDVAETFRDWLNEHTLLLDDKTRVALTKAIFHAPHYRSYDQDMQQKAWDAISDAGMSIVNAVDMSFLPDELTTQPVSPGS